MRLVPELRQQVSLGALIELQRTPKVIVFSANGGLQGVDWRAVPPKIQAVITLAGEALNLTQQMADTVDFGPFGVSEFDPAHCSLG